MTFKVKFWGVRGSIACPTPQHMAYGGNTACVEIAIGGKRIILDCGTGLRNLGHWFLRKDAKHAHILLSHSHWDHINGFPFFAPAFQPGYHFTMLAGHMYEQDCGIRDVIAGQMHEPTFPVPLEAMQSKIEFQDFTAGDRFPLLQGVNIRTAKLNHPNNATGYRIEYKGKSVCYVTDTEHIPGQMDQNILGLIEGADLVIYDSTYTDKEFPAKVGWGHSTWQEGVRLCQAANVKKLAIFHHDPDHEDAIMDRINAEASKMWSGTMIARENLQLVLGR